MSSVTTPSQRQGQAVHQLAITEAQKRAIADNLRLEITERARRLRAQYAVQAEGLRFRLEMRVNRIPAALRRITMQELLDRAAEQQQQRSTQKKSPVDARGLKRQSEALATDKENDHPLTNPKKRQKPLTLAQVDENAQSIATSSPIRNAVQVTILSPRSLNSQIIPPTASAAAARKSPVKSVLPRSTSPIKSAAKSLRPLSKSTREKAVETASGDVYTIQDDRAPPQPKTKTTTTASSTAATRKGSATASTKSASARSAASAPAKKGGFKSAFASLTSGKRGAAAGAAAAKSRVDSADQSDAASATAAETSSSGRVLRKRT